MFYNYGDYSISLGFQGFLPLPSFPLIDQAFAAWDFADNNPDLAVDRTGNGHNLTGSGNSFTFTTDPFINSYALEIKNDSDLLSLNLPQNFSEITFSLVFYNDTTDTHFLSLEGSGIVTTVFWCNNNPDRYITNQWGMASIDSTLTYSPGWHHAIWWFSNSSGGNIVDGVKTTNNVSFNTPSSLEVKVGSSSRKPSAGNKVSHILMFDRLLTTSEEDTIKAFYGF